MRKKIKWSYLEHDVALPCPAGDRYQDVHVLEEKNGNLHLKKVDCYDIRKRIASYEDSTSLEKMLKRFNITGDATIFNQRKGFYADVSGMTTNAAEALRNSMTVGSAVAQSVAKAVAKTTDQAAAEPAAQTEPKTDGGVTNE